MTQADFITFESVKKSYDGETYVVKGLDLSLPGGEFLTLLGPSGSGKTTTLMMLAGFEQPTSGAIFMAGSRIDRVPSYKRNIGVVFQNYALFPHMSVADNVAFPLRMRRLGQSDVAARVRQALDMVRMQGFEHRRPSQLSGGQQQRVALARALVFEPKLVLMDEPLGALDKQLREHMQLEIKRLHARLGVNIVYVTHDQGEALTMSDRVAVFHNGTIQQIAPPHELYEAPANSFVAQFIGENNAVSGKLLEISGRHCRLESADGAMIQAVATDGIAVGEQVSLSLRPEKIKLLPMGAACANQMTARISEVIYHGDHARLCASVCGRPDFMIKVPSASALSLRPGTEVVIGWDREDCRALAQA
jgi:putative spermidine/putrescine transport system ATP-binding protein